MMSGSTAKTRQIWVCIILCCCILQANAQAFKAIGYLPHYRFSVVDQIDFSKLTHVNISFANPDMNGQLSFQGADIDPVIYMIKEQDVEVYISLAGGALTPAWAAAWKELIKPANRVAFIDKIIDYTLLHQFDGIDVDLEWSHVDEHYSGFVIALREAVDAYDLGLTAALPGTYRYPEITAEALSKYDWVNMMVYDLTGPWQPNNPGPHSPYSFALNAMNYWEDQGMSKDQLTLGVPFYGYDFTDANNVFGRTYNGIVGLDADNAYRDQHGDIYYNGIPTIEAKTELALEQLSGIMIWELGQDNFGEYSLLDRIDSKIQEQLVSTEDVENLSARVFPNPFDDHISIKLQMSFTGHIRLYAIDGKLLGQRFVENNNDVTFDTDHLESGMYVLQVISSDITKTIKITKS